MFWTLKNFWAKKFSAKKMFMDDGLDDLGWSARGRSVEKIVNKGLNDLLAARVKLIIHLWALLVKLNNFTQIVRECVKISYKIKRTV